MKKPKVSVIVPIYNTGSYLKKCIESIITQTYKNLEIILVDDGSSDESLKICREFQKQDSRIKVFPQENHGVTYARRTGIRNASGEVIGFVDSDDWIECDMYEKLTDAYLVSGCDMVSSGIYRDYESYSVTAFDVYDAGFYSDLEETIYPTMVWDKKNNIFGLYAILVNKLFKREILSKVCENINTDVFYGEDSLMLYSYCMEIKSIYILKKSFYHYNIRGNSVCRTADIRLPGNMYLLYNELKKTFLKSKKPYMMLAQLKRYMLEIMSHMLHMLFDMNVMSFGGCSFPYEELFDSQVVIYGAGGCGQALYREIVLSGKENHIVAWLDKKPENKEIQCLHNIEKPSLLKDIQYDYILVAVLEESLAEQIRRELIELYHVDDEKIIWGKASYRSIFDDAIML